MSQARIQFATTFSAVALLALAALGCPAQSLRDLLVAREIPEASFPAAELEEIVFAVDLTDSRNVYLAYLRSRSQVQGGAPRLVRLDRESGAVTHQTAKLESLEPAATPKPSEPGAEKPADKKDECCTVLAGMRFLGDNLVLSARYASGTVAQILFTRGLKQLQTIYGQELFEIAPGEILSSREGSRLAAVHADRLDLNSLGNGTVRQLYPLAGDRLRTVFVAENEREMPPRSNCREADRCDAEIFDETVSFAGTNRAGSFAIVVNRLADHQLSGGALNAQSALYVYAPGADGWRYCQQEIEGVEADTLEANPAHGFKAVAARCQPNQPVTPAATKPQSSAGSEGLEP